MLEGAWAVNGVVVGWLLTYLLHSTVVIGLVWALVRLGLVRAPATRDLLWKLAAVAGLVTASVAVAGQSPGVQEIQVRRVTSVEVTTDEIHAFPLSGTGEHLSVGAQAPSALSAACRSVLDESGPPSREWIERIQSACDPAPTASRSVALFWLWLGGALVGVVGQVRARWATLRALGPLVAAGPRAARAWGRVSAGRIRGGELAMSSAATSPCVSGRTVIVPHRCEVELTEGELEAALGHELAHLGRRDGSWLAGFSLLSAVLWIQPLNRLAREAFLEAAELVCDDWAASRADDPLDLARSISRVAEWSVTSHRPLPAMALARGNRTRLSERVQRIANTRGGERGSGWMRWVVATLVLVPPAFLPVVPVAREARSMIVRADVMEGPVPGAAAAGARRTFIVRQVRDP